MKDIVILAATRTPIGNFQGGLAATPASRLGATAIMGALVEAGVSPEHVTDVLMGNVLQAGQGQAPARQAAIYAGLPSSARAVTIHKVCGSGLQAVMQSSQMLATGMGEFVVAGGMENMSQAPYLLPKARDGYRIGHQQVIDSLIVDGLWDPYSDIHMGNCAEQCAAKYNFTREEQDAYAIASFQRANAAQKSGRFAAEITPVEIKDRKGNVTRIELDEGPAKVNYDKVPQLKPAFQKDGTITPANASSINDGAAALVLAPLEAAQRHNLKPIARVVAFGGHAQDPVWFTTAPVQAAKHALTSAGWQVADVDLWEVNEAFAVVPMAFMREMGVAHDKVNVDGGAISLGHPIGCSGARIIVTLIAALKARGLKRGVAAICIGGGEGLAACVEMV
ncbi:MAG: thiolase family protein [Cephaloticoccus sp.]|nr:thiolase family protein [Cephaloticoccus sp.]MCF7760078.1 thiolase family protein [Cephaloticoccus sp.]